MGTKYGLVLLLLPLIMAPVLPPQTNSLPADSAAIDVYDPEPPELGQYQPLRQEAPPGPARIIALSAFQQEVYGSNNPRRDAALPGHFRKSSRTLGVIQSSLIVSDGGVLLAPNSIEKMTNKLINILIHGTGQAENAIVGGEASWTHPLHPTAKLIKAKTHGENLQFVWTGDNTFRDRTDAGVTLGRQLFALVRDGNVVNVIGHSHGGTVAKIAGFEFARLAAAYLIQNPRSDALRLQTILHFSTPQLKIHQVKNEQEILDFNRHVRRYQIVQSEKDIELRGAQFMALALESHNPLRWVANAHFAQYAFAPYLSAAQAQRFDPGLKTEAVIFLGKGSSYQTGYSSLRVETWIPALTSDIGIGSP